ncbi:hypothetical protein C8R43DRAFT_1156511, partial [Mycena crocata]
LHGLHEDVLVCLFDLLEVPQILVLRQTCRRMQKISELRIVWTNACNHQLLRLHYPFPDVALEDLSIPELERNTRYSYRLALGWLSENPLRCHVSSEFDATNDTPVSDLRFVHGHGGTWLLAVSKGIWSVLALWELGDLPRKRCEWSRRDCLLQSFVLNGDPQSAATLAVSLMQEGHPHVEIISLGRDTGFRSISTIDSGLDPVYFHGDILVLCDPIDVSVIMNWKTGASAVLQRSQDASHSANDRCIQVIFAPSCLLVVRARSLTLFSNPPLTPGSPAIHAPIAVHSFGWVDGVAVTTIINPSTSMDSPPNPPLSILLRPEPDDPWAADDDHALDLYVLHPEPAFPLSKPHPYVFPPTHTARVPSTRGSLQCSDLRLASHGTAVWIAPQDRSAAGLLHDADDADARVSVARQHERLVCAAFPGPLFPGRVPSAGDHDAVMPGALSVGLNNWKALDYDEARRLVAVGSTRGKITVLSL